MKPLQIKQNRHFVGREYELTRLEEIQQSKQASIIVVYGRRRIGKTEFLEQGFRHRNIIKFEGIEGKNEQEQMHAVIKQLAYYTGEISLKRMPISSWTDVFLLIADFVKQ